jgi:hypothetical protein
MKNIISLLLLVTVYQGAYAQDWRRIQVDNALSVVVDGKISRDSSAQNLAVGCRTSAGMLTIDKMMLPDSIPKDHPRVDDLEYFVKGYLLGLEGRNVIEVLENKPAKIDRTPARTVLYRNESQQTVQISFILFEDRVYRLRLTQASGGLDAARAKIFDSVKVLR